MVRVAHEAASTGFAQIRTAIADWSQEFGGSAVVPDEYPKAKIGGGHTLSHLYL